jgi:hypothetical protein
MKQFLRCEGHLSSILVFLLKKSYNFGIWYKKLASRVVRYAVKGPKPSIWASCNVLHQKLGSAAKIVLIPCSMQLCYQTLVLCAIFSRRRVVDIFLCASSLILGVSSCGIWPLHDQGIGGSMKMHPNKALRFSY